MKTSATTFIAGLSDLKHYINGLEIESQVMSSTTTCRKKNACKVNVIDLQEHWKNTHIRKRRFNYNSIIVSLYGYLEQYIENLVSRTANLINEVVPSYKHLSTQIKDHHLRLSLDLIKKADHNRFRGKFTPENIIDNLNCCLNGNSPYRLNCEAFAQHSANFKMDVINETFKFIGIENACNRMLSKQIFKNYLEHVYPERDASSIKIEEALSYLQDLAERRNQVAHGVLPDELLSNEILLSYIDFFEAIGHGLYQVCYEYVLPHIVEFQAIPLGNPTDVLLKGSVICLFMNNVKIKVGDIIIARSSDGTCFYSGAIEEIQLDDISHAEIEISARAEVGLRLPFKNKSTYDYFLPKKIYT